MMMIMMIVRTCHSSTLLHCSSAHVCYVVCLFFFPPLGVCVCIAVCIISFPPFNGLYVVVFLDAMSAAGLARACSKLRAVSVCHRPTRCCLTLTAENTARCVALKKRKKSLNDGD